jgi:hypothetical protein
MTCNAIHPDLQAVSCERSSGSHPVHSTWVIDRFIDWQNTDYVKPAPRKGTREQQDARTRKKLRDMAENVTGATKSKQTLYPSESDRLGRTALYMRKYKGKWVSLEELEMKTIAGSGAKLCITALINRYGWEIKTKTQAKDTREFFMLVSE